MRLICNIIGKKWTLHIIFHVSNRKVRFNELKRSIPGITSRMLSRELRKLEQLRLIKRKRVEVVNTKVEYSLTKYGYLFYRLVERMEQWIKTNQRYLR